MSIRVLLADDHGVLRDAVRQLLESSGEFQVVGAANDGREAVAKARELAPEVVLMDVSMPELNGIEATSMILAQAPATGVVMLSMHASTDVVARAFAAGARGYVLKDSSAAAMLRALKSVAAGGTYVGEGVIASQPAPDSLTETEREIIRLLAEGNSNAQAAARLGLSARTVETYRGRLMHKLQLGDLPALVKYAIRNGLATVD